MQTSQPLTRLATLLQMVTTILPPCSSSRALISARSVADKPTLSATSPGKPQKERDSEVFRRSYMPGETGSLALPDPTPWTRVERPPNGSLAWPLSGRPSRQGLRAKPSPEYRRPTVGRQVGGQLPSHSSQRHSR